MTWLFYWAGAATALDSGNLTMIRSSLETVRYSMLLVLFTASFRLVKISTEKESVIERYPVSNAEGNYD